MISIYDFILIFTMRSVFSCTSRISNLVRMSVLNTVFFSAYEAASYNACVPFKPAYTKWGLDIVGLSDLLIIFDDYIYLNNELNVYNRAAYQSVDQWLVNPIRYLPVGYNIRNIML